MNRLQAGLNPIYHICNDESAVHLIGCAYKVYREFIDYVIYVAKNTLIPNNSPKSTEEYSQYPDVTFIKINYAVNSIKHYNNFTKIYNFLKKINRHKISDMRLEHKNIHQENPTILEYNPDIGTLYRFQASPA